MFESVRKRSALRAFLMVTLLLSSVLAASFVVYALQPVSIPLEVKEPLEILDYPSGFSLYPGENETFEITVQNSASVTYFVEFDFRLNDTAYQARYVIFSNYNYSIVPGTQKLTAWLTIVPTAPPANLILTIDRKTDTQLPSPSPAPSPTTSLAPSLTLLGSGARWAAGNGTKALYINWKDNWNAHNFADGANWEWCVSESVFEHRKSMTLSALEQSGLDVVCAGDIPNDLSGYALVVLEAYYAIEPQHEPLIRQYVSNGGGIVLISGTACHLTCYSKNLSTDTNLTAIQDWLGCGGYSNAGGTARVTQDNPFGTQLLNGDTLYFTTGNGAAGFAALDSDAKAIAHWDSGAVFSFTHEYGNGRIYYQAHWEGE